MTLRGIFCIIYIFFISILEHLVADMLEICMYKLKAFVLPALKMLVRIKNTHTHRKQHAEPGEQMGFLALILHLKDKTTALWFHSAVKN